MPNENNNCPNEILTSHAIPPLLVHSFNHYWNGNYRIETNAEKNKTYFQKKWMKDGRYVVP